MKATTSGAVRGRAKPRSYGTTTRRRRQVGRHRRISVRLTRSTPFGGEAWASELDGTASCGTDAAYAVALDPDGDVVAGGTLTNTGIETTVSTFALVKVAITDGRFVWQREIDNGVVRALVFEGSDVIAVGEIDGSFSVVKVNGITGDVLWRTDLGAGEGAGIVAGAPGPCSSSGGSAARSRSRSSRPTPASPCGRTT